MPLTPGSVVSVGRRARLNVNSKTLCFARVINQTRREIVSNMDNSICGDIDISITRAQKGRKMVRFTLVFDLTYPLALELIPMLGLTIDTADTDWSLGATDEVVGFPLVIDMVGAKHSIAEAFVSKWVLRGQKGGRPISLEMEVVGVDEISTGTFTEDKIDFGAEYAFTHGSLTMHNGSTDLARPFDRIMLQVDNGLVDEHNNSITITDATIGNRQVVVATSVPYNTTQADLYFAYRDDSAGKNVVFTIDNGEAEFEFTLPKCLSVGGSGNITGRADQIRTPVTMLAFRSDNSGTRVPPLSIACTPAA